MPKGYKVKNWKFLTEEFGILDTNHNYCISERSLKTRPLSFIFWGVSYLVDNFNPHMIFEDMAFLLMFSDMKYFEMHVAERRTGWGRNKTDKVVKNLMRNGYLKRERPTTRQGLYGSVVYDVEYKYYPTPKYTKLVRRLEDEMEALFKERDLSIGKAEESPNEVKNSPKY